MYTRLLISLTGPLLESIERNLVVFSGCIPFANSFISAQN